MNLYLPVSLLMSQVQCHMHRWGLPMPYCPTCFLLLLLHGRHSTHCMQLLGRRYNTQNGGPAPENLTNDIYTNTTKIKHYYIAEKEIPFNIDQLGTTNAMVQHADTKKFGGFQIQARDGQSLPATRIMHVLCQEGV